MKTSAGRPPDPRWHGSARALAIEVLRRVDTEDAYADLTLGAALDRSRLDARDRAFATDLVYGTLRWRGRIDHLIDARALRGTAKIPPAARAALRLGAYQILFSRSVPARAAVDETVRAMQALNLPHFGGFANAILRRLARERDTLVYPDPRTDPVGHAAAFHAHPPWIVERLFDLLGEEEALRFLEADNALPPLTLRVNQARIGRDDFLAQLSAAGVSASPGRYASGAVVLDVRARVATLPGFEEGWFVVQDEASQLVGMLTGAAPGERVLDVCAAPGGKTSQLAEAVGPRGEVVALDIHGGRLSLVESLCARLGLSNVRTVTGDAREISGLGLGAFDRVLVDAPCSGLGVLRRNPDARWRVKPDAPARLAVLQREILAAAVTALRPGGALVYGVCTFTPEETGEVASGLLAVRGEVVLEGAGDQLGEGLRTVVSREPCGEVLRTWPHRHGTDAFFAARFRRTG